MFYFLSSREGKQLCEVQTSTVGYSTFALTNWKRCVGKKSLTALFSFQIALYLLVKERGNLALHQESLRPYWMHTLTFHILSEKCSNTR